MEASFGCRLRASSADTALSSISARNGCPIADKTVSLPSPAADAWATTNAEITAALTCFNLNVIERESFACIVLCMRW